MKKRIAFLFSLLLVLCFSIQAFAADTSIVQPPQTVQTQNVQQTASSETSTSPSIATKLPIPAPINVEQKNVDGSEYLIKTFETAVNFDPTNLIENGYEKDGFLFAHLKTEKEPNEQKKTKDVTEPISIETETQSMEGILKRLPSTKDYESEGFAGVLNLDTQSIVTEVSGYTTKSWTVSTVQEYPGLMYADPSYVPQSATKDGTNLPLVDVKWVVTGTGLAGDTLVPTEYKATATYSKKLSNQVPAGYVTTATYKGAVTKSIVDTVNYVVTYVGTPIYIPTPSPSPTPISTATPEPIVQDTKTVSAFSWGTVFGILGTLICLAGLCAGSFFLFQYIKSHKGIQIYNLIDKDYICVGRQVVDFNKPVLDLNHFKDVIQSNSFAFVLDKPTSMKLYGRNIAVTLDDVTVMHMIKGYNEEYRFNLELGGILDVK